MENSIKKILIIRFGAIGDVVHSTALFRAIKKTDQNISIHYLTFKAPSLLLLNDPDINRVWVLEDKTYKNIYKLSKELKNEKFDLIINLHPSVRSKVLTFLVKPKKQLVYKKTYKMHAVENFWFTAKPLFEELSLDKNLHLFIPEEVKNKVKNLINKEKEVLIGFNMGVSPTRHGRKWPFSCWVQLATDIFAKYNAKIILFGSDKDSKEAEEFLKEVPHAVSFCGKLSLIETAAAMSLCNTLISGDTGPLHIATAVGTKSIGVYGCPSVSRTGPYGEGHLVAQADLDCVPCDKKQCKYNGGYRKNLIFWKNRIFQTRPQKGERQEQRRGAGDVALTLDKDKEDHAPCMYNIKPEKLMNLVDIALSSNCIL
ncbi:MAG: glycosyltransferase family 9 protein [Candidatus Gastranaerophilaceae bacterium]|jgi:ADP-heptose:LPS heptosyltransferase